MKGRANRVYWGNIHARMAGGRGRMLRARRRAKAAARRARVAGHPLCGRSLGPVTHYVRTIGRDVQRDTRAACVLPSGHAGSCAPPRWMRLAR